MPINDNMYIASRIRLIGYIQPLVYAPRQEDIYNVVIPTCIPFEACHSGFRETNCTSSVKRVENASEHGYREVDTSLKQKPKLRMCKH